MSESYTGGPLSGVVVSNTCDGLLRRTNLLVKAGSTWLTTNSYAFNALSGRLQTVSQGANSATYSYLANSPLVGQITFQQGTTEMTTTKSYDNLNRLLAIASSPSSSFAYTYNAASQRTAVTNADNSRWVYQYDDLGQVVSGKKIWSDGSPVEGQQFDYTFDDIGNRTSAVRDNRSGNYTANRLNQYTTRDVPGYVNLLGEATNLATVTVNNTPATRKGSYFRSELTVTNTSNPLWLGITNLAVLNNGSNPDIVATNLGSQFVAKTPEAFTYDLDGNLTSDSLWTNVWNGENRRTHIESRAGVPTAGKVREQWTYLPDGRWIERIVSTNNGSSYVAMQTNRYVWDGQVLLAVLNQGNALELTFLRGLDLSGSLQGAGGVGGLLAVQVGPAGPTALTNTTHFVAYDGNGNVAALVNAADGIESARYEYGPFAEPLRITGVMGKVNPIRFSTQYADDFTGDVKYLFRDYRADSGRWLSRDPIGAKGGINTYAFVNNSPLEFVDLLGQFGLDAKYHKIAIKELDSGNSSISKYEGSKAIGLDSAFKTLIGIITTIRYVTKDPKYVSDTANAEYIPLLNWMKLRGESPGTTTVMHESVHAYNTIINHLSPFRSYDDRVDEGMAYATEQVYEVMNLRFNGIEDILKSGGSEQEIRSAVSRKWKTIWSVYATPDRWDGGALNDSGATPFKFDGNDFYRLRRDFNLNFSCAKLARVYEKIAGERGFCMIFSCDDQPDTKFLISAGVEVSATFLLE